MRALHTLLSTLGLQITYARLAVLHQSVFGTLGTCMLQVDQLVLLNSVVFQTQANEVIILTHVESATILEVQPVTLLPFKFTKNVMPKLVNQT